MRRGAASGSLPPSHSLPARPSAGGRVDGQRAAHGRGPASARFPAFGGEPSQAASAETRSPTRATSWSNRSRPERCRGERAGRRSRVVEAKPQRDFWLSEGGSRGRPKSLVAASELRRGATAAVRSGAAATVRSGEAASLRRSLSAISGFRRGASREPSEEPRSPIRAASWSHRRRPRRRRGDRAVRPSRVVEAQPQRDFWLSEGSLSGAIRRASEPYHSCVVEPSQVSWTAPRRVRQGQSHSCRPPLGCHVERSQLPEPRGRSSAGSASASSAASKTSSCAFTSPRTSSPMGPQAAGQPEQGGQRWGEGVPPPRLSSHRRAERPPSGLIAAAIDEVLAHHAVLPTL